MADFTPEQIRGLQIHNNLRKKHTFVDNYELELDKDLSEKAQVYNIRPILKDCNTPFKVAPLS